MTAHALALPDNTAIIPLPRVRDYTIKAPRGGKPIAVTAYDGVILTDAEQAFIDATRKVSPDDLARLSRVMVAMVAGKWPYSPEQTAAMPMDDIRAAIDSIVF